MAKGQRPVSAGHGPSRDKASRPPSADANRPRSQSARPRSKARGRLSKQQRDITTSCHDIDDTEMRSISIRPGDSWMLSDMVTGAEIKMEEDARKMREEREWRERVRERERVRKRAEAEARYWKNESRRQTEREMGRRKKAEHKGRIAVAWVGATVDRVAAGARALLSAPPVSPSESPFVDTRSTARSSPASIRRPLGPPSRHKEGGRDTM
ncbi:hypothetical protein KIPB_011777 [Kipferlia bialata]|uniref:Uncharacterized protein n=1 Tax=Kipferlia bialata TaxID=797122 RepID=A0A9K3GNH3_9EUKA|nr:hypothetical protein KIPB_011777 [Kipferlia bialata]|eukprot:g11777.t1